MAGEKEKKEEPLVVGESKEPVDVEHYVVDKPVPTPPGASEEVKGERKYTLEEKKANREKEKKELLEQAQEILAEYGGAEGNVPLTSPYWELMNRHRSL
jgi:hypothetical protein